MCDTNLVCRTVCDPAIEDGINLSCKKVGESFSMVNISLRISRIPLRPIAVPRVHQPPCFPGCPYFVSFSSLSSNTLFFNIFKEFCKGSTDGDPVAVIISWTPRNDDGIMPATSAGVGRDMQQGMAHAGSQQHLQEPASPQPQHAQFHRPQLQNQQGAAIRHLTARELHDFLFGASHDQHPFPPIAAAAGGGKQQRNEACNGEEVDVCHSVGRASLLHLQARSHGGAAYTDTYARRHIERSEAAAMTAGAGAGDGDGGGWCLLQKYIGPTGTRNSTLRCAYSGCFMTMNLARNFVEAKRTVQFRSGW